MSETIPGTNSLYGYRGSQAISIRRATPIAVATFFAVLAVVYVDINSVTRLMLNTTRIGSPLILLLCIATYVFGRFRFASALGTPGRSYMLFFTAFLIIGAAGLLIEFSDISVYRLVYYSQMYIASIVILLACAVGTRYVSLARSPTRVVTVITLLLVLQVLAVAVGTKYPHLIYSEGVEIVGIEIESGRSVGLFANANNTGMAMCIAAAYAFSLFATNPSNTRRLLLIAMIAAAGIACVSTFSRSAILTFCLLCLLQLIVSPSVKRIWGTLVTVGVATAVFVGIGWFLLKGYESMDWTFNQRQRLESFTNLLEGNAKDQDTGHRFTLAEKSLEFWSESPMFGHGIGASYNMGFGEAVSYGHGTHNLFIALLVDTGIFGLGLFLLACCVTIIAAVKCRDPMSRTLVFSIGLVILCDCMVSHNILESNIHAANLGVMFGLLSWDKRISSMHAVSHGHR